MVPTPVVSGPAPRVEVGPLRLWSPVILAPMAGVTDAPFRRLCRRFGEEGLPQGLRPVDGGRTGEDSAHEGGPALVDADTDRGATAAEDSAAAGAPWTRGVDAPAGLYVTEMVTSRALVEGNAETLRMVRTDPEERVRSIQLYGVDPATMAAAVRLLVERDLADHIDLNFGCPVPKVTRKGGGAALPWKRDLFEDLLRAVVGAAEESGRAAGREVPVTIKMRVGIDDDHLTYLDAARTAQRCGVAGIGLHARTQAQYYSGHADWTRIARLREEVDVPVFGNGDVFSAADAQEMMERTGCDAVVIGRGCQGRPWLFRDLVAAAHGLPVPAGPSLREVAAVIETHARWCVEDQGEERRAMCEMRKHVGWCLRGFAVGGSARRDLNLVSSLEELHERLWALDLDQPFPASAEGARGRAGTPKVPHLPEGWLDSPCLSEAERSELHLAEDGVSGG